jgi:hypothetical protein
MATEVFLDSADSNEIVMKGKGVKRATRMSEYALGNGSAKAPSVMVAIQVIREMLMLMRVGMMAVTGMMGVGAMVMFEVVLVAIEAAVMALEQLT